MGIRYVILLIVVGLGLMCFFLSHPSMEEQLRHIYFLAVRGTHYWDKFKHPANSLHSFLVPSPPPESDDFEENHHYENLIEEKGKAQKVKEAVKKSFEKTKSTVEGSARSAAEIAGETIHKTADKLKESITERTEHTVFSDPQDEL